MSTTDLVETYRRAADEEITRIRDKITAPPAATGIRLSIWANPDGTYKVQSETVFKRTGRSG